MLIVSTHHESLMEIGAEQVLPVVSIPKTNLYAVGSLTLTNSFLRLSSVPRA